METIRQRCPKCQSTLELPASAVGRTARCPACEQTFEVLPGSATTGPAPIGPANPAPSSTGSGAESGFGARPQSPASPPPAAGATGFGGGTGYTDPYAQPGSSASPASANPYAMTPGMAIAEDAAKPPGEVAVRTASIDTIISASVNVFSARWQPLVIGGVISFAFNIGNSFFQQLIPIVGGNLDPAIQIPLVIGIQIAASLIGYYLMVGLIRIGLDVARGGPAPLSLLFPPPAVFLNFILVILLPVLALAGVAGLIAGIGAAIYAASGGADEVGIILLVLGGVALGVMYFVGIFFLWPSFYVVCDERAKGIEALRLGYAIARVNKLNTFLLFLISMLLGVAGVLMCCIGGIVTTPATFLVGSVAYLMMTSQRVHDPAATPMLTPNYVT